MAVKEELNTTIFRRDLPMGINNSIIEDIANTHI